MSGEQERARPEMPSREDVRAMASRAADCSVRAAKATPGPWTAEGGQIVHRRRPDERSVHDDIVVRDDGIGEHVAAFIAAARADVPDLAAMVARLAPAYLAALDEAERLSAELRRAR